MNQDINPVQAQAVINALTNQRNDVSTNLALATADLTLTRQDVEGLNKIIAGHVEAMNARGKTIDEQGQTIVDLRRETEGSDKIIERNGEEYGELSKVNDRLEKTIDVNRARVTELEAKLEDLRVTPIDSPAIKELESKYNDLEEDRDNKHHEIIRLRNVNKTNIITHTKSQLHNEDVIREQRATIAGKDHVIKGIQADLEKAHCFANGESKD